MSEAHSWLYRYACEAVSPAQQRIEILKQRVVEAEQAKAHAETELKLRAAAVDRLVHYDPFVGGRYQCPHCWITNSVRSDLKPIDSDGDAKRFRCKTCHAEMTNE
jgi:glutathione S-transferase